MHFANTVSMLHRIINDLLLLIFLVKKNIGFVSLIHPIFTVLVKFVLGWKLVTNRYIVKMEKDLQYFICIAFTPKSNKKFNNTIYRVLNYFFEKNIFQLHIGKAFLSLFYLPIQCSLKLLWWANYCLIFLAGMYNC